MFIKSKVAPVNHACVASTKLWHERLGHVNTGALENMVKCEAVSGISLSKESDFFCANCPLGKQFKFPFKKHEKDANVAPGEIIHTDLCGPMQTSSVGGARFFILFKDESSGFRNVNFLKHKSDTFDALKNQIAHVKNQFGKEVKVVRADNGTEFTDRRVKDLLAAKGIKPLFSAPYTPEQNGRVEREMRTVVECARTMLLARALPQRLWAEAVNTAVYTLNRTIGSRVHTKTPFELWYNKKPDLSHMRVFGSDAYALVPDVSRKKWDAKSTRLTLVGYEKDSQNYRLFHSSTGRITISRNVLFDEKSCMNAKQDTVSIPIESITEEERNAQPPRHADVNREMLDGNPSAQADDDDEPRDGDDVEPPIEERGGLRDAREVNQGHRDVGAQIEPTRYSLRPRESLRSPDRLICQIAYDKLYDTPDSYKDALSRSDAPLWERAIKEELDAHSKNGTWEVVKRPEGRKLVGHKWVFKIKSTKEADQCRYKARLCAQGFSQEAGVDYSETFSPVVRFESVRILLSIAVEEKLSSLHFDVSTAYLNSDLNETLYMRVPDGLNIDNKNFALKLKKAIYGLKQSGRCWNQRFDKFIKGLNLVQSSADKCIYTGLFKKCKIYLALYVDDGLLLCRDRDILNDFVNLLKKEFDITVANLNFFVGMEIVQRNNCIFISQEAYINKILKKFEMMDANTVKTPADPSEKLTCPTDNKQKLPYRELVGSLLYLSIISRPDITYAVGIVSRYLDNYDESHWRAAKRILRYLKGTRSFGLLFCDNRANNGLVGYSDADYAGDIVTRRSTSGYVFLLNGNCVVWSSKRQSTVSLSTTEAEFIAANEASREAIWLRKLLSDIGRKCVGPTTLLMDNQSAIKLTRNPEFHCRSKHIDVRYQFICEKVRDGLIDTIYVNTNDQYADVFTKALSFVKFNLMRTKINVTEL